MQKYKQEFIEFMVRFNFLIFGDFVKKSDVKHHFLLIQETILQENNLKN